MPPDLDNLPRLRVLKWLTDVGPGTPAEVRQVLSAGILASPSAVLMATLNAVVIDCVALNLCYTNVFLMITIMEILCAIARAVVIVVTISARRRLRPAPVDISILLSIAFCALQGGMAFAGMTSGNASLQIMSATLTMAIIGPVCAFYYRAPRLAFLLVCLLNVPLVAGFAASGRPCMTILVFMMPPFLYGSMKIINHLNSVTVEALTEKLSSDHRALHDPLTGLQNRLGFNQVALRSQAWEAQAYALLCLDLDGFKKVNDNHGHQVGDLLLQAVAKRLGNVSRPGDILIRMGGDEFVVIVAGLGAEEVGAFAERIIHELVFEPYRFGNLPPIGIGVSIGFACSPDDGAIMEDLYSKADTALYASKAAGKGVQRRFEIQLAG